MILNNEDTFKNSRFNIWISYDHSNRTLNLIAIHNTKVRNTEVIETSHTFVYTSKLDGIQVTLYDTNFSSVILFFIVILNREFSDTETGTIKHIEQ